VKTQLDCQTKKLKEYDQCTGLDETEVMVFFLLPLGAIPMLDSIKKTVQNCIHSLGRNFNK
jgi:hypothetical protein